MSEEGWPTGPSKSDFWRWYIWAKYIAPKIKLPKLVTKVVTEQELSRHIEGGWNFVTQLKSGNVIVEKFEGIE